MVGDSMSTADLQPRQLSKQEFANRLGKLMHGQGWNQSELARRATAAGTVEVTRDNVSNYVKGNSLPTPPKLESLAAALGVPAEQLLPNHMATAIHSGPASYKLEVAAGEPGYAWLQVNRLVKASTGAKVIVLLEEDNAAPDRTRGR